MTSSVYAYVGYGILLVEDLDDEGVSETLTRFGAKGSLWEEAFLRHLYPEGPPKEFQIALHKLRGHDHSQEREGHWEIPILVMDGHENYGITSSGDNPDDISDFLRSLAERRNKWDGLIADFVERCKRNGINLAETIPHPVLYIS